MQKITPHQILPPKEVEQNIKELFDLVLKQYGTDTLVNVLLNSIEPYAALTVRGIPLEYHLEQNLQRALQQKKGTS